MILDQVYISKDLYISNQIKSRSIYLLVSLGSTDLSIRDFCHFVNTLTFIKSIIEFVLLIKLTST